MVEDQINAYIASLPEAKRNDLKQLHLLILQTIPAAKLWFLDGKNSENKVVSNPNIGYGSQTLKYADGTTKEFYQVGLSANLSGISVYIIGLDDKNFLRNTYGNEIGKASVTGYCIKFKLLTDINRDLLLNAIEHAVNDAS